MTRTIRKTLWSLAVTALISTLGVDRATACPNCKEAVSLSGSEAANVASGYNWSVLFMISVPFTMLGTGVFMVRRAARQGLLPEM
jgi:hypothetical protein